VRVIPGDQANLTNVTNIGNLTVDNSGQLNLGGTLTNTGTVNLNAAGSNADINIGGGSVTLAGSGTINFNAANSRITGGSGTLNNLTTIRGGGQVGVNAIYTINNSIIRADNASVALTVDPVAGGATAGFVNNGTLLAAGGTLTLTGNGTGFFENTTGRIHASTTDVRLITNVDIRNGTLMTSGSSLVRVPSGDTANLTNVTNIGNLTVDNNANLNLGGTLTNTGTVNLNAAASTANINIGGSSVTLAGTGTINMNSVNSQIVGSSGTLNNTTTIAGAGNIGVNALYVVNTGTIRADNASAALTLDPVAGGVNPSFTNNGVLRASGGGHLIATGSGTGFFIGTGTVDVQAASRATFDTSANFTNGAVTNNGTVTVQNSSGVNIPSITGNGTLIVNNSSSATIRANGTQAATSKVVSLAVTNSSKLDLNDNALVVDYTTTSPLAGIRSNILSGYANGLWNGVGINSTFAASTPTRGLGYAEASDVGITTSFRGQSFAGTDAVLVMYTLKGDTNLDRTVTSTDFNSFVSVGGYGVVNGTALWSKGDFDYNGKVNTIDFNFLAGNFGLSLPAAGDLPEAASLPSLGSVVPEPSSLLVGAFGLALIRRRRAK